jgi:uncharacterized protein (DUF1778 family)
MPRAVERKEHPLSMRLPETDIAIIDRAAALRGRSRTAFKAFMAALSGPATPVPEMIELFQRAAPWETGGSDKQD